MTMENQEPRAGGMSFLPVLVRDVMTSPAITVDPSATVKEIAELLLERDIHAVPVLDVGDVLVGMVAESDLISRGAYPTVRHRRLADVIGEARAEHRHHWSVRAEGVTASEVMTRDVITCRPAEPVGVVTRRMLRRDVRLLPVIEGSTVVGVVSRHDLLALFDRPDSEIRERLEQVLADPLWSPELQQVEAEVRDGVVVLTGTVLYPSHVQIVGSVAARIPGVIAVTNLVNPRESEPRLPPIYDSETS